MRIFVFALLIMLAASVIGAKDIPKQAKPYGGTLIWGTRNKPTIINPILTTHSVSASLLELIFNRLVRLNSRGDIEPDLAESWDVSSGGLVYTFHLRKGVRFHDGVECTAYDVKFTYDRILDPEVNSSFSATVRLIKDYKVIDTYTFQITLKQASAFFIYRLVRDIIPKHLLEDADLKNCAFNIHPIGTGPFRFKEWKKDNQIVLEYNPDYYEGRPYLDKVIVRVYPDSRELWTGIMRGEADYATFIEREDYEVIKNDPAFKTYAFPLDYYYAIFYNIEDPLLADKRIREAIAYGIDRKALTEKIAYGYGIECAGPFYPQSSVFNPSVKPFEYNPEKSLGLLKEAGWEDSDYDGILEKEGKELELRVLVDSKSEIYKRIIMTIRQQVQQIGIKIKVVLYDDETEITEEFLKKYRPQAHLKLFFAGTDIDPDQATITWYSEESKRVGNLWIYKNKKVDRLFELGGTIQDRKKRQAIYQRIHKIIYEDQPACFLYFPFVFHAVSAKFENVDEFFNLYMPYYTMKDWYIIRASQKSIFYDYSD